MGAGPLVFLILLIIITASELLKFLHLVSGHSLRKTFV